MGGSKQTFLHQTFHFWKTEPNPPPPPKPTYNTKTYLLPETRDKSEIKRHPQCLYANRKGLPADKEIPPLDYIIKKTTQREQKQRQQFISTTYIDMTTCGVDEKNALTQNQRPLGHMNGTTKL